MIFPRKADLIFIDGQALATGVAGRWVRDIETAFSEGRKHTHQILHGTASSHNRLLYLQQVGETFHLGGYDCLTEMHQIFWKAYFDHMQPRPGAREFLAENKLPVYIVTDFAAENSSRS